MTDRLKGEDRFKKTFAVLAFLICHSFRSSYNSPIKHASRASALRADGVSHTMGLVLTQPISPTPWTRPQKPVGASSSLTIRLLKKDIVTQEAPGQLQLPWSKQKKLDKSTNIFCRQKLFRTGAILWESALGGEHFHIFSQRLFLFLISTTSIIT